MRTTILKISAFLLLLSFLVILSCQKENYIKPLRVISACGCDDPLNQLEWLKSKINNGKDPSKTSFIARIWIKEYQNKDIIAIQFPLQNSLFSAYECSGMEIHINQIEFYNSLSSVNLIYLNEVNFPEYSTE